jgi:hypothetical protein
MEIARDLFNVPTRCGSNPADSIRNPGRQRGCRHLGVRQSEDTSDGTRGLDEMQVNFEVPGASRCEKLMKTRQKSNGDPQEAGRFTIERLCRK